MAKAKKTSVIVTHYALELTQEEAQALLLVIERVGGCPESTPRGRIDSIQEALAEAGVSPLSTALLDSKRNEVWFK